MKTHAVILVLVVALWSHTAAAQTTTVFGPLGSPVTYYYAPTVAYSPVVAAPTVAYYGATASSCCTPSTYGYAAPATSYYASYPSYTTSYYPSYNTSYYPSYNTSYYASDYTTYYGGSVATPVTSYYSPTVAYSPVVTPTVSYYSPGVVGSTLYGTPQYYMPGQPVRNALRWITP